MDQVIDKDLEFLDLLGLFGNVDKLNILFAYYILGLRVKKFGVHWAIVTPTGEFISDKLEYTDISAWRLLPRYYENTGWCVGLLMKHGFKNIVITHKTDTVGLLMVDGYSKEAIYQRLGLSLMALSIAIRNNDIYRELVEPNINSY